MPLYGTYDEGIVSKLQFFALQIVHSSGAFDTIDVGYSINAEIVFHIQNQVIRI